MKYFKGIVSCFLIGLAMFWNVASVVACSGSINICGDLEDYLDEAEENCNVGDTMTFVDVCYGNMEIEYEVGSLEE